MVKFYVLRIKSGKMNVEDVPPKWVEAVKEALLED